MTEDSKPSTVRSLRSTEDSRQKTEDFAEFCYTEYCIWPADAPNPTKWRMIRGDELELLKTENGRQRTEDSGPKTEIFHSIYNYTNPAVSEWKVADFYMDFDCSEDVESARNDAIAAIKKLETNYGIKPENLQIGFSGRKGFYAVLPKEFFLTGVMPKTHLVYKKMAELLKFDAETLDLAPYKTRSMWRMNNTWHRKGKCYKINLAFDELTNLPLSEIIKLAQSPRDVEVVQPTAQFKDFRRHLEKIGGALDRIEKSKKPKTVDGRPKTCIVNLDNLPTRYQYLSNGASEGGRNSDLCVLVGVLKKCGLCGEEIVGEALEFNRRCSPPENEGKVRSSVKCLLGS